MLFVEYRELAYQIADQFRIVGKPINIKDCVVTGGMGESSIERGLNLIVFVCVFVLLFE